MKQRILLVEDEKKLANTLQSGLNENDYDVAVAYDGQSGKDLIMNNVYDLVMLDINLPYISGFELCKMLRQKNKRVPIMLITALNFIDYKVEGFDSGADDYIAKPFEFRELLARTKALIRRSEVSKDDTGDRFLRVWDLEMDLNKKEVKRGGNKVQLTAKEFQLLEYFLKNMDKVVSREDIARDVWDIDFDSQTNVIDVYVNFLRKKIDKEYPVKLIHTQVGMGYILKSEDN